MYGLVQPQVVVIVGSPLFILFSFCQLVSLVVFPLFTFSIIIVFYCLNNPKMFGARPI